VLVVVDDGAEDVPIQVRLGWVAESFPIVEVVSAPDLCGHESEFCTPACSERYARWLRSAERDVDVVFSGEPYGDVLAESLGATSVRLERASVAGRVMRADLPGNWELLAPVARAWYCRRVVVVGAESTGTTTLAQALGNQLGTLVVPEYGRAFTEEHGIDHEWVTEDFEYIARQQAAMEDDAAHRSGPVLVCDTDVLATAVWHERYLGCRSSEVEAMAAQRRPALYILTSDDIPFVQDGLRDGEHIRSWMTGRFRDIINDAGVPWIEVRGSVEARMRQTVQSVAEVMSA
jgi:HTH-type transcriptional regulator, transcriptional repressor of NAD biosynthesis genes